MGSQSVTIAIYTCGAVYYTDAISVVDVKNLIENGQPLDCWWLVCGASATRYDESILFYPDKVDLIRTEGDDD